MDKQGKSILVTGATGQQGGATARHLLKDGWRVRAVTRDANSDKAQALAALGAELVEADFDDRASLDRALAGVYGVFSVQNFWLPGVGAEGETRQGKAIADAAKAAGVQHFVYTSVGGAERQTGIPHFESKRRIEEHIEAIGLPATFLRPVAFMDNYNWARPAVLNGTFQGWGLKPDKTLQLIAADDIGAFTALVFDNPQDYIGQAIELAGDELTEAQLAETFTQVIGRPVALAQPAAGNDNAPDEEQIKMVRWFNEKGYQANIPVLRQLYPGLQTFEQYLRATGWENAEPVPLTEGGWGNS
jgi:uncharacterized protein YbjT (DUF2867 family)